MLQELLGKPLSLADLREIYLIGNNIKSTKRNRAVVTFDMIGDYLRKEGYKLKVIRYWNYKAEHMSRYFEIVRL